jgi:PTS system fructose-specific IIC component
MVLPCLTVKMRAVKEATVLFAKSAAGVDYEALDGQPFLPILYDCSTRWRNDTHMAALAELSKYLLKDGLLINYVSDIS